MITLELLIIIVHWEERIISSKQILSALWDWVGLTFSNNERTVHKTPYLKSWPSGALITKKAVLALGAFIMCHISKKSGQALKTEGKFLDLQFLFRGHIYGVYLQAFISEMVPWVRVGTDKWEAKMKAHTYNIGTYIFIIVHEMPWYQKYIITLQK